MIAVGDFIQFESAKGTVKAEVKEFKRCYYNKSGYFVIGNTKNSRYAQVNPEQCEIITKEQFHGED
jgi:hypothetical protein